MGEVCGRKFFDTDDTTTVSDDCRLCQDIKVKTNRLRKEEENIRRWKQEGDRFKSSIAKAEGVRRELMDLIQDMESRRMIRQYQASNPHRPAAEPVPDMAGKVDHRLGKVLIKADVEERIYALTKRVIFAVGDEEPEDKQAVVLQRQLSYFSDIDSLISLIDYLGDSPWIQVFMVLAEGFNEENRRTPFAPWKNLDPEFKDLVAKPIPIAPPFPNLTITTAAPSAPEVVILTMNKPPENRVNSFFAQTMISALRYIESSIFKPDSAGCVILTSSSEKFFCTGLELDESDTNVYANADGFYPLLATLLDYPYPTIAVMTGHTFGGGFPLALSCDYRIMNARRGFVSIPAIDLGLHFDGIGAFPRLKLRPQVARKVLLEAHRFTGREALEDGLVDALAEPDKLLEVAVAKAREIAPRARMGVYGLMRSELLGEALEKAKSISYVHRKRVGTAPKAKI
ncbi:hypothetical protein DV738_g4488, partial [Chaetothyriales sp. CBS 135597]